MSIDSQGSLKSRHILRFAATSVVAINACCWIAASARAQTAGADGSAASAAKHNAAQTQVEEVVVTAQRRNESVEHAALAIRAFGGAQLQQRHITTVEDLTAILPDVSFSKNGANTIIAIRGVGLLDGGVATDARTGVYLDGVYLSRSSELSSNLFDIKRIEVLSGPQGTLYGRNATGGVVNIITEDPSSHPDGNASLTIGNYGTVEVRGAQDIPISDRWSARVAVDYDRHSGYAKDVSSGRGVDDLDGGGVRAKVQYDDNNFLKVIFSGDYGLEEDHSGAYHYLGEGPSSPGVPSPTPTGILLGGTVAPNDHDIATDPTSFPELRREHVGTSVTAVETFGANSLTEIAAYRKTKLNYRSDLDSTSAPVGQLINFEDANEASGELRFNRSVPLYDFVAGAYYLHDKVAGYVAAPVNAELIGGPNTYLEGYFSGGTIKTNAYAAYTQLKYKLPAHFYVEAGVRYSDEKKSIVEGDQFLFTEPYNPASLGQLLSNPLSIPSPGSDTQSKSWGSLDPRATVGFQPSSNFLAYATYAKGFKSGGFNLGGLQPPFQPEHITDYEGGLKVSTRDKKLTANVSAFYYNYTNMQVFEVNGLQLQIVNAARSTVKGVESDVNWVPLMGLRFGANLSFLSAKYNSFDTSDPARPSLGVLNLAGNQLPQAPRYRIGINGSYTVILPSGDLTFRGDTTWTGRQFFTPFDLTSLSAGPTSIANGSISYALTGSRWEVSLFAKNLTDQRYINYAVLGSALTGGQILGTFNPPRTFGVTLSTSW